jgi:L-galactose dehydrogenase/L-glyceraldehyde 3-phosphate reductase
LKYRKMGRTGLKVSEIGFGCGNIGGLIIRGSREERLEAVRLALKLGINYFDTAPSYGDGRSETNLGRVLDELEPDLVLATKVRLSLGDLDDIHSAVCRSVEMSLDRLRREYVDVLQLHSRVALTRDASEWPGALSVHDVLGENGVAEAFEGLRSRGLIRFIGFTGLGETAALHRVVESGRFDVVQAYFNLLNPSAGYRVPQGFKGYNFEQLIDKAAEIGMGVAAIRVMAAGAVGGEDSRKGYAAPTVRGPMVPGGEYEKEVARARRLGFLVQGEVGSLPQAALRFVLMHPGISTALVGFSNIDQIQDAVTAAEYDSLPQTHMERLKEFWGQSTP